MPIDLTLNEDQLALGRSAQDFFRDRCPRALVRELETSELGYQPALWQELADLGWLGIGFPENYGGAGGTFLDAYPLCEAMGQFLVPSPYLDTVAVAGEVILQAGSESQKQRFLPEIAEGRTVISPAVLEASGAFGPRDIEASATTQGAGFVLSGTKILVGYASAADYFLVAARTSASDDEGGITLLLVDAKAAGISISPMQNIAKQALFQVEFSGVIVAEDAVVGGVGAGWAPLAEATTKAAVLQTLFILGASKVVLDMTAQYATVREQFGKPIGSNQAVQYMVSDIHFGMHTIELLVKQAAYRIDAGKPYGKEAAIAIVHGKQAAAHMFRQAHEVHAGIGVILDHDLNLFSRRSKFWEKNLGDGRYHLEQVAIGLGI